MKYADFFKQGEQSARRGDTRSPGNEYRMPVFGAGNAWQNKSFADGFRAECASLGRVVLEDAAIPWGCLA